MRILAMLIVLAVLSGCAGDDLPEASGPWHQLNAGYWQASPADLDPQPDHAR
jgi:hypothetical protein